MALLYGSEIWVISNGLGVVGLPSSHGLPDLCQGALSCRRFIIPCLASNRSRSVLLAAGMVWSNSSLLDQVSVWKQSV